jgi:hypothetical protein
MRFHSAILLLAPENATDSHLRYQQQLKNAETRFKIGRVNDPLVMWHFAIEKCQHVILIFLNVHLFIISQVLFTNGRNAMLEKDLGPML